MSRLQQNLPNLPKKRIVYPDTDGQPMAENTRQFQWIVTIEGGLETQYRDDPNVFVAGDLFWYPVEGEPGIRQAPDILVAFGRPRGHRPSYMQWQENGIAPQVVFEILSPGNRTGEMTRKFIFYERYGVQEYVIYDPDNVRLEIYCRQGDSLQEVVETHNWASPLLGCRFDMSGEELVIYRPDGKRFKTFLELSVDNDDFARRVEAMERQAADEKNHAEEERLARLQAQQRADQAHQRAERLAMKLRELGIDPDSE